MYLLYLQLIMFLYVLIAAYIFLVVLLHIKKSRQTGSKQAKKVAFFHPFCNDGGGGQKVLWSMIEALLQKSPKDATPQQYKNQPIISIYSLQNDTHQILSKASNRFNINLSDYAHRINFVHIKGKHYLTPKPRLTMLCHIFFPMIYCFKCIWKYQPDIFYDTTGFAFNFFLVKLFLPKTQCRAYVHYPFISEDMVSKVRERRADFNNDASISKSVWKTKAKLFYYTVILMTYKLVRFTVKHAQANSSWTQAHMNNIWGRNVKKLYPPCTITEFQKFKKNFQQNQLKIISLAQFRPEKNHPLQINVINHLVKQLRQKNDTRHKIRLYICGTTRGADDERLLQSLKQKVQILKLEDNITFCVNMKFPDLLGKLQQCNYGIHSMEAQHFGISVVEMLAAGCLIIAHNSAGPKLDIIKEQSFLAQTEQEYLDKLRNVLYMSAQKKKDISQEFRSRMGIFGEVSFKQNFRILFQNKQIKND